MKLDLSFYLVTILMSQNLSPIRKSAYKSDRWHSGMIGMIGTVTQRDTSLELGSEPSEGGEKPLEGGGVAKPRGRRISQVSSMSSARQVCR